MKIRNEMKNTAGMNANTLQKGLHKQGLNANALKIIAIIAMSIDHITWMIYPGYPKEICGYALIGHYLKKTGASIYEATIMPTVEILKQTEDLWQRRSAMWQS